MAMLKNPTDPQYELEMISLEQLVPQNHLMCKVAKAIDFKFIHDEVTHLYYQDNGPRWLTRFVCLKSCC